MKLQQLQYFTEVVKNNSITKAAKKLYVSQPAISTAIKELEDEFGTKLFIRNNNILTVTEEGEKFYQIVISLLEHAKKASNEMHAIVRQKEMLRIGIPPMIGAKLIPTIIENFNKLHPNVELDVIELGSFENQKSLSENSIDLCVTVIHNNQINKNLNYIKFSETELVVCVNKNHPLAQKKFLTFEDLENEKLILMKEDTLQSKLLLEEFENHDIIPNIKIRSNQLFTISEILKYTDYAVFVFNNLYLTNEDIVQIPFKEPINFDIILAWNKKAILNDLLLEFIAFIKNNEFKI